MNIPEFKVVISFWCCDAKLMEIREPDVIWSHRYLNFICSYVACLLKAPENSVFEAAYFSKQTPGVEQNQTNQSVYIVLDELVRIKLKAK